MNNNLTHEVKKILKSSAVLSQKMNHMQVYPEHVMLAIMSHNNNTAMHIIKKLCDVDIQDIYDKVYSQLTYRIVDPPMSIKTVNLHDTTTQILDGAYDESKKLDSDVIHTEHLLTISIETSSKLSSKNIEGAQCNLFKNIKNDKKYEFRRIWGSGESWRRKKIT